MGETENHFGPDFPGNEERLIRQWRESRIYEKSLEQRRAKHCGEFVFYEGPPTANGHPHPGHCLTRAIKDLYPRYKTMKGFLCERRAGWDTHGLPVEVEVCKELGIHSKEEIESFGVEPFIHRCVENVFRYTHEWEELTERLAFWINLDEAYVTFHRSYVESVWWGLKNLFDRDLLYQGHKIVWWWAQGGTALSSGEVGQGYRQVADPSVFVRFPIVGDERTSADSRRGESDFADSDLTECDLIVWTTTPWTLPSNQFVAVHPALEYGVVEWSDDKGNIEPRKGIVAVALVESLAAKVKKTPTIVATLTGRDLVGLRYRPPFEGYYKTLGQKKGRLCAGGEEFVAWRVGAADFVTTESGTGLVHEAPAFGEVDFEFLIAEQGRFVEGEGPELICAVAANGTFTDIFPEYAGRWVKDCDKEICRDLKNRGLLFAQDQYLHDYPFCWRASNDPLIQYPRKSWFIRTTQFKEKMLENNATIRWSPEHIRTGRFGNFLESNVDWALSRERFWGTPLPIWVCEKTGYAEAVECYDVLLAKPGIAGVERWEKARDRAKADAGSGWSAKQDALWDHLKVHKPYIDAVTYDSPKSPGAKMRRVPEVIDCWFDSGAMPFAQVGYPHKPNSERAFARHFPADFISEAIDQTRGWFYSLLAISTLLFSDKMPPHPFKNCIVLGLMLGEDGQKMSKSLRNYREPAEIFNKYGADALRWYFYANQTPWTSIRYSEAAIRDSMPEFMIRLWNVASFFEVYRKIDGFSPENRVDSAALARAGGELTPEILATGNNNRPVNERAELDRWILSELNRTVLRVTERMDAFDHFAAAGSLNEFVESLSNWYVRRSRNRFWAAANQSDAIATDKADAYWTLWESLLTLAKLIAPFVPFLAERLYHQLTCGFGDTVRESVHLCDYPVANVALIDEPLSGQMGMVREMVSLGRNARMGAKLKVRQPLSAVEIVLADPSMKDALQPQVELMAEELNVKSVTFIDNAERYIDYAIAPDFKKLGPKLGKSLPAVKSMLAKSDAAALLAEMNRNGKITLCVEERTVELFADEVQIRLTAKEGFAAAQGEHGVVILAVELTPELLAEGRARELVRLIQDQRKELGCDYTDRIRVGLKTESGAICEAVESFGEFIRGETLTESLIFGTIEGAVPVAAKIEGDELVLYVINSRVLLQSSKKLGGRFERSCP